MLANSRMFWKVRANPARATLSMRVGSSLPSSRTDPDVGVSRPVRQLKNVVFPAPLGPMSPTISPAFTVAETSETATRPPKRFVMWSASSSAVIGPTRAARTARRHRRARGTPGLFAG